MAAERIHQKTLAVIGHGQAEMIGNAFVQIQPRGHAKRGREVGALLAVGVGVGGLLFGIDDGNGHCGLR